MVSSRSGLVLSSVTGVFVSSSTRRIYFTALAGWSESTYGARSWADLPANAVKYIRRVEELTKTPVTLLSTSPERDDTILVTDPFGG